MRVILSVQKDLSPPVDLFLNPFNKLSPYRRPIGTGAVYASDSHQTTQDWNAVSFNIVNVDNRFGYNVYENSTSDPVRTIGWTGRLTGALLPFTIKCPLMRNPTVGNQIITEGVVILHDRISGEWRVHEFVNFNQDDNGNMEASIHKIYYLTGDGVGNYGMSASKLPGMMQIVRGREINTNDLGPIGHCGTIGLRSKEAPQQMSGQIVWPAQGRDGFCSDSAYCNGSIPYGGLFALPPSVNIGSMGLTPLGVRMAQQFRDYGMYAIDNGGQSCRGQQDIISAKKAEFNEQMRIIKPRMRMILNNASTDTQPTCSGGGIPIAPNYAYDA